MSSSAGSYWTESRGKRPVRVANCSGSMGDSGYQMLRQMSFGPVDFVTGDYLAELNLARNAEAYAAGKHEGFEPTAWDGLQQSMETIEQKRIKVIINGGGLNPLGLARKCQNLIALRQYNLKVAAIVGDDVLEQVRGDLVSGKLPYLDAENDQIKMPKHLHAFSGKDKPLHPLVSAHAYLGARGIVRALENGADIIICGRVADASPVVGAAWWWHSWTETSYEQLAGSLIAGHLIECSAYVTGANFSGFEQYEPEDLFDLGFGIAEIEHEGSCVITKHEGTKGFVTVDTVKCQLLYEIQGNVYLNSDVTAILDEISVKSIGKNRIQVTGVRGACPPETTKLAVGYQGGFQSQILLNLGGYAVEAKHQFYKKQICHGLNKQGLLDQFDDLEFQCIGTSPPNARTMLAGTTYLRIFAAASTMAPLGGLMGVFVDYGMQHVSGAYGSTDFRTAIPRPYLAYFPALYPQASLRERALFLAHDGSVDLELAAGHPPRYQAVDARANYDSNEENLDGNPPDDGLTCTVPLGDVALGRSGDKGANVSVGLYVTNSAAWPWFRTFLSRARLVELMGDDWHVADYHIERVELPKLHAVHFVVYGLLGRGVSATASLDGLGKGFVDFLRARHVDVPEQFLGKSESLDASTF